MPQKPASTRNLKPLPDIESLRKRLQQLAVLDNLAGLELEAWEYEFHPAWNKREQMGAYKSGSGDELFVHFTPAGCFIKGFAHESNMSPYRSQPPQPWPGVLDNVPAAFASSLKEPAFEISDTTFVIWRLAKDSAWSIGPVRFPPKDEYGDGSEELLGKLLLSADEFAEWLAENYEIEIDGEIVAAVFDHQPLTKKQLSALQPEMKVAELVWAVKATGYPVA